MNAKKIDYIYQYSKYYGNVLYECESLYGEGRGFVLLMCFFNIVENIIYSVNENFDSKFENQINLLKCYTDEKDIELLHELRKIRNKYTHKDLNKYCLEFDGVLYSLSEDGTALKLYEIYSAKVYDILIKIIKNKIT